MFSDFRRQLTYLLPNLTSGRTFLKVFSKYIGGFSPIENLQSVAGFDQPWARVRLGHIHFS